MDKNTIMKLSGSKESARNTGASVQNHFVDVNKMVSIGFEAERQIEDVYVSNLQCA